MPARYIRRSIEPVLRRAAREFPAVVLTGPRQSGKTTTLKRVFGKSHRYVSLDLPDVRASAASDPRGFLDMHGPPVILDEAQYAPGLLSYVKERIDAERDRAGGFVLSGSQNLLLAQGVTESLAGRVAILRLLPLSFREATDKAGVPLPWEGRARGRRSAGRGRGPLSGKALWERFLRGGYPELSARPRRDHGLWHSSYIGTYLERDVRSVRQVGDLAQFHLFLRALAARSAQILSMTELSRELGVALNTAKAWLSVLEATYQVIVLRPYFVNVGKRLVKRPKVYFADTGTLCRLVGLRTAEHAMAGPMAGAVMETAVLSEVLRALVHRGIEPHVYFWRTSAGTEVDIIVDAETELVPIEVKLSSTPRPSMAEGIAAFRAALGKRAARGYVVHPGRARLPLGPHAEALPFCEL